MVATGTHQFSSTTLYYPILPTDDGEPPYQIFRGPERNKRNFTQKEQHAVVENLRGREELASLDLTGFQWGKGPTAMAREEFQDDEVIKSKYYAEVAEYLKKETGGNRVFIFDHTTRKRNPTEIDDGTPGKRQPVPQVHVDQTGASSIGRVKWHLPEEADQLLSRRFALINLWRPIGVPAYDWPLACCDYRSVDSGANGLGEDGDCFTVNLLFPDRVASTMGVLHNKEHKWKYVYGMTPDEFLLIKCWDSKNGIAKFTPHTAFEDSNTPPDAPCRESIEVRALVFFDEDN